MKKLLFLVFLPALLAGCSSVSVSRDYDTNRDFTALQRYAWQHAEQPQTGDPRIDNDLKIFVLARARGPGGIEAMVECLCGFDQPAATGSIETGRGTGEILVDLTAQPVSTYEMAD